MPKRKSVKKKVQRNVGLAPVPYRMGKFRVDTKLVRSRYFDPKLMVKISSPEGAIKIAKLIQPSDRERLLVLYIDGSNKVSGIQQLAVGERGSALVAIDVIARAAILSNSHGVIMVHNHPGGDPTFSAADRATAHKVKEGLKMFGIVLLDFMTTTPEGEYGSMSREGILR